MGFESLLRHSLESILFYSDECIHVNRLVAERNKTLIDCLKVNSVIRIAPLMRATESPAPGPRHIVEHGLDWTGMFNLVHMLYNMSCPPTDVHRSEMKFFRNFIFLVLVNTKAMWHISRQTKSVFPIWLDLLFLSPRQSKHFLRVDAFSVDGNISMKFHHLPRYLRTRYELNLPLAYTN